MRYLKILLVIIPACCGLAIVGAAISYALRPIQAARPALVSTPRSAQPQVPAPSPIPITTRTQVTPTKPPSPETGLTYGEICTRDKSLTDLQWNEHLKQFQDKKIKISWHGWINDVYQSGSGYNLYIAMESPTEQFIPHADVKFGTQDTTVSSLNKGQQVWFSGTLSKVSSSLGSCDILELSDATIEKTSP